MRVLVPSIAWNRTVSISGVCEGNEAHSAGVKVSAAGRRYAQRGNELGEAQTRELEHEGISAASKSRSAKSRVRGLEAERPNYSSSEGRPMTRRKKQANALRASPWHGITGEGPVSSRGGKRNVHPLRERGEAGNPPLHRWRTQVLSQQDESALRVKISDPLGPESRADIARESVKRRQGLGGMGIQVRTDHFGRCRLKHSR
jgi:hypothetical protein